MPQVESSWSIVKKSKSSNVNDQHSSADLNQLACCLKNAIFSKYVSNYLIGKTEEMWILYENRIETFLKEKHLDVNCDDTRPQVTMILERMVQQQEAAIVRYKREIEKLCSARNPVQLQSTQPSSIRGPKTPRCVDRYKIITHDIDEELDDMKRKSTPNDLHHHCRFEHGELFPFDSNTKIRTIRMTYSCVDDEK